MIQSYAAGYLEAVLTQKLIFDYIENAVIFLLDSAIEYAEGDLNPPQQTTESRLDKHIRWMKDYLSSPAEQRMKNFRKKLEKRGAVEIIEYMVSFFEDQDAWISSMVLNLAMVQLNSIFRSSKTTQIPIGIKSTLLCNNTKSFFIYLFM